MNYLSQERGFLFIHLGFIILASVFLELIINQGVKLLTGGPDVGQRHHFGDFPQGLFSSVLKGKNSDLKKTVSAAAVSRMEELTYLVCQDDADLSCF